jgi:hypothetical protein
MPEYPEHVRAADALRAATGAGGPGHVHFAPREDGGQTVAWDGELVGADTCDRQYDGA